MMTIPVAVLPKTLKRVPVEAVIQELQVAAPVAEVQAAEVRAAVPVAVNQTADQAAAPAAVVQATAVPVEEVNLVEVALAAAVPVEEVNLAEAAPAAENLPVVKVQNNV